jgi:ATP synthase subunit 6
MLIYSPLDQFNVIKYSLIFCHSGNKDITWNIHHILTFPYYFTNITYGFLLILIVYIAYFCYFRFFNRLVPKFFQLVISGLYFFNKNLMQQNLLLKKYRYFPYVFILFITVFLCNYNGLIPYSFVITSQFTVTFCLALISFVAINVVGLTTNKEKIVGLFLPSGTPIFMTPFLILIELVTYFARVFSLSIRLFANMLAGHALYEILGTFSFLILITTSISWLALFPIAILLCISGLEMLIAGLQTFVFITLVNIYFNDVIHIGH